MKSIIIALLFVAPVSQAHAQACWVEQEHHEGQMLMVAGGCTENISISTSVFSEGFCGESIYEGVITRRAASCPTSVKMMKGLKIVTGEVVARCDGLQVIGASGKRRILFYAPESKEIRDLCVAMSGRWIEGAR